MPELPDIVMYIEALEQRILGVTLRDVRLAHPFLLRTVEPPVTAAQTKRVVALRRLGKRIAIGFEDEVWFVFHLMIAGRFHWRDSGALLKRKTEIAALDFDNGTLVLTEAGTKKRASLHVVYGEAALRDHDPGGLEVLESNRAVFETALTTSNHTLKRALTDPRLFSGIGNAYSDEILHRARLSPIAMTQKLSTDEIQRLYEATRQTLLHWVERLRVDNAGVFPGKVTAFRDGMAVHGCYGEPCPDCGAPVQRIRYAKNETNYCARCQTNGRVLADRSLSRLLKKDWPRTLEELEELRGPTEIRPNANPDGQS
jgi:formamidopyrimidine-DNA glycosylase